MSLEQLLFAVSETKGMDLVAASFSSHDADSWDAWNEKLRPHTRLLGRAGTSFGHLSFPDGSAAVLRRSARPGDAGRNVAHALVGDRGTISRLVPAMTTCWLRWLDERPISNRLPDVVREEFDPSARPKALDDPILLPLLACALARPSSTYSVIGVPDGKELSALWTLRTLLPDREWTFSTYEQNDAGQPNLPRLVFLPGRPSQEVVVQEGRLRIDVREEPRPNDWATKRAVELLGTLQHAREEATVFFVPQNHVEVVADDTPTTVIEVAQPESGWPFPEVVHGNEPLPQRLARFTELAGRLDGAVRHEQLCAWIEDRVAAPSPFVAALVQARGGTGFDAAISRRWLAEQGVATSRPETAQPARLARRPAVDENAARAMWGKHEAWSRSADHHKDRALRYRMAVLGTLAGSAVLTVVAAQFNARWLPVTSIAVAVLTAALVIAGIWVRAVKEPAERDRWASTRIIAEQVKAEVCKYLAGAAPYRDPRAVALLKENVERVEGDEQMHELASATPLIYDVRSYVDGRVREQISYHRATAKRLRRNLQRMRMAEYVFQGMAAALAAVGAVQGYQLAVWAGLLTTIAGAVTAHIAQSGYDRLVVRYRRTVDDLEELARSLPERPDPAAQDDFVTACEQVIARQNEDWLIQLTTSGRQP
ncbi:DUF4231 domain-containing protein [Lentzea aerocolonigenes]|uniref:DUF4231 domain-containing protein n=1 Tax=Lentzea aerocolonigenes TaxID=68170 RepID=UPI0004C3C17C|nr:DUF4231 domain-containing protein [Lentzea aerocolonigenes]MCP2242589.1 Protein of unknown function (DUF4231) [Lentzea aerocolonigenes]